MCGIGGYQLKASENFNTACLLTKIQQIQHHRGPDGGGQWVSKQKTVGLCHNRLAVVDLTDAGAQPMQTQGGHYTITFNGEIYNWQELKSQLTVLGVVFRSHSDTEVLLYGYKVWGVEILQKLRGMFAFALWDEAKQILFCARDTVGKKPFVYSEAKTGFFFASEIPALKVVNQFANLDLSQNDSAIAAMLLHNLRHIPEPVTAYKGLCKLRPGHALIVKNGKIKQKWRYWSPVSRKISHPDELRYILEDAVAIRSVADVPVGAMLSGGIDSTSIVNLMQQQSTETVRTYAFGVDGDDEDLQRARLVSKELGTEHKEFYFEPDRQYEILKRIITTHGEPVMLLPLIHAYELCEAIRDDGIKVVMNGNGADELFFGYTGHLRTARVTRLMNWFGWARNILPETSHPQLSVFFAKPGRRKAALYQYKAEACWPVYLKKEAIEDLENIASQEMEYWGDILPSRDFIDESNYISLLVENSHSVTIAGDLPGMMASVEVRSPFLDQEIVAAAMGIHFSQKVKGPKDGSQLKNILRKAVHDLVPSKVMSAPKRGFGMGIQERDVLLNGWRLQADELFNNFPESGLFDSKRIRQQWTHAQNGGRVQWSELAKLFAIGIWLNEVKHES